MRLKPVLFFLMLGLACTWALAPVSADDNAREEQAIRQAAKEYEAALAKGDRQALADFWTEDGEYFDELGESHPASELVAEAGQAGRPGASAELRRSVSKIRFLTPDVALEDGVSEIELPGESDAAPVRGHYHATWIKQNGRWRLASLCEVPIARSTAPSLDALGWMVGVWTADDAGVNLEVSVRWNATGTFLLRDLKATKDGAVVFRSTQRIGRDPATDKLTSWSFDTDGGHGEATWTKEGDSWVAKSCGVLPDGRLTSGTVVIEYNGKNSFTYKTLAATVSGEHVADQQVRFSRKSGTGQ